MSTFSALKLPLISTELFEKTIISYINGNTTIERLYHFNPDLKGFKERISRGCSPKVEREKLVDLLLSQYSAAEIELLPDVKKNILSLSLSTTFTVTTGHQLNIFSGPLYVLFKLLSTINLAERLKHEFPAYNFVPVYWMATEDHDIAEINNISLFSKKIQFETDYKGLSGKLKLNEFEAIIHQVKELFGTSPFALEISELITKAYSNSKNLADATRIWTNALLGKYGLVILDANEVELKKQFIPYFEKELKEQFVFTYVNKATEILNQEFPVQVNPRELNIFYIHDESRNRIVKSGDSFQVLNTNLVFTEPQILEELISHPEKFSPNVLLRPIYQEVILPNLAYVGGPAEIAYWLELKFVFETLGLSMPVLMLRNSSMIIDHASSAKWRSLGFEISELFKSENELIRTFLDKKNNSDFSFSKSSVELIKIFDQIAIEISGIDQSLVASAESEKQKALNSIKLLQDKVIKALKKKEEVEINQIKKIRNKFLPDGTLQERTESLIPFYLKWGSQFIDDLKQSFDPFDNNFILLQEKE